MKTEKTLATLFLVGLISKLLHWPGADTVILLSLPATAVIYFPTAFYFFCDKAIKRQNLALSIVSGLFLSLIPLGILFRIFYWPGGKVFLLIGTISALVILATTYFLSSKAPEELATYYKNMLTRTIVLTVLALTFFFVPTKALIKIEHWDDQELARLKILHVKNPDNEAYKKQYDEYLQRQDSMKTDKNPQNNENE